MCSEFYSRSLAGRGPGLCIPPTVNICNRFLASGQKLLSVSGCRSLVANAGSGQINNKAVPSSPALLISVLGGCIPALLLITPAWVLTDVPASPSFLPPSFPTAHRIQPLQASDVYIWFWESFSLKSQHEIKTDFLDSCSWSYGDQYISACYFKDKRWWIWTILHQNAFMCLFGSCRI